MRKLVVLFPDRRISGLTDKETLANTSSAGTTALNGSRNMAMSIGSGPG